MDVEYRNDVFPLFLKKVDEELIGEFETVFKKPIHFNRSMECSLIELNIPNHISSSKLFAKN